MTPFDITKSDIKALGDEDLRTLVANLATSTLRRDGRPVSGVRSGGRQEAKDGGIDVEVKGGTGGYLPRRRVGFQVKKADLAANAIQKEMCPDGHLRPAIRELAKPGAYIIASGAADLSKSARELRLAAMRKAIGDLPRLHLDIYDGSDLARWVNEHPGIAAWVRSRISRELQGWKPFGNWSRPEEGVLAPFLVSDDILIQPAEGEPVPIADGISLLRNELDKPRAVVRLVGLSGLGKTRLVQALFDERIGEGALDPSSVVYTDISYQPTPGPQALIAALAQSGLPALVIVDNCPPDTHRALAKEPQQQGSKVSVLTVEYDVTDDTPEDTKVFRLVVGDEGVVPQLLSRRRPDLSSSVCEKISEFSGGNARLALALANTVEASQSLAKMTDEDLLKRLFHQRRGEDAGLMRVAEACSLVYSFHIDPDIAEAELPVLAQLAGTDVDNFYAQVAELQRRGLVQSRGEWRALLPHALAHRLARAGLERRAPARLRAMFESGPMRLLRSFTRRIGVFHDVPCAARIAEEWLAEGGMLGAPAEFGHRHAFGDMRQDMFQNVAPLAPTAAVGALERSITDQQFVGQDNWRRTDWARLLHKLAYEPQLFSPACLVLARFLADEAPDSLNSGVKDAFLNLFNFTHSGTLATLDQRLAVIRRLLMEGGRMAEYGVLAMDRLLHARLFTLRQSERFGARVRTTGLELRSDQECEQWYSAIIDGLLALAQDFPELRASLCEAMAVRFGDLWFQDLVRDRLEATLVDLAGSEFWRHGWLAVRNAIKRGCKRKKKDAAITRLRALEQRLRPNSLVDQVRAWTLSECWGPLGLIDEDWSAGHAKVEAEVRTLGRSMAQEPKALTKVLHELSRGSVPQGVSFGCGLADSSVPLEIWSMVYSSLAQVPVNSRNFGVAIGFLSALAEKLPEDVGNILDRAVEDDVLGTFFPILQARVAFDDDGVRRLDKAIGARLAPASVWERALWCDDCRALPSSTLQRVVDAIRDEPEGGRAALRILHHRLKEEAKVGTASTEVTQVARDFIYAWDHWERDEWHWQYQMTELVKSVLRGPEGAIGVRALASKLLAAMAQGRADHDQHEPLLPALLEIHPDVLLDEFICCTEEHLVWRLLDADGKSHLDVVPADVLIRWGVSEPSRRLPFLAARVSLFAGDGALREQALALLDAAPDKGLLVRSFITDELRSRHYFRGDRAEILSRRSLGLQALSDHSDLSVREWVANEQAALSEEIERAQSYTRVRDERFE